MKPHTHLTILAVLNLGLQGGAFAGGPGVTVGDLIRVKTPHLTQDVAPAMLQKKKVSMFASETFLVGKLVGLDRGILSLSTEGADSAVHVSVRDVTRLDVWSRGTHKTSGAVLGFLGGAVIGGIIGNSFEKEEPKTSGSDANCSSYICPIDFDGMDLDIRIPPTVQGGFLGAALGALAGGLIGSTMDRDRWEPAEMSSLRARVLAGFDGEMEVACSVSF